MTTEFKLPDIGEGLEEGEIIKWLVKEGDSVESDQNIVQIETDKAVADLPSPVSGTILKIHHKEGETVKVGEVLVTIGDKGEKVATKISAKKAAPAPAPMPKPSATAPAVKEKDAGVEMKPHAETMKGEAATEKVQAAPAIRKLARDLKIDLASVKGSGAGGKIVKSDLEQAKPGAMKEAGEKASVPQQTLAVKKKYDDYGYLERIPLKGIRKTIANNMVKSLQETAQVTTTEDIDVSKLWALRKREKKHFAIQGIKLTFLPFIIKSIIAALKENPTLNASIDEEDIILKKYYNIGVAVESDAGLMVPVVKIAEQKSIAKIAKEIEELAKKVRERTIDIMDMKGGSFTITNYGSIGGMYGTPIINPGEAAILGIGRIFDKPVLDEKTNKLRNIKVLPVSLTFDHRITDGAQASRFLESLKIFLEDPEHLFLEINK